METLISNKIERRKLNKYCEKIYDSMKIGKGDPVYVNGFKAVIDQKAPVGCLFSCPYSCLSPAEKVCPKR